MIGSERMPQNHINDGDTLSRARRRDIDGLLKLAEELQEKGDSVSKRIEQYRFMQIAFVVAGILLGLSGLLVIEGIGFFNKTALIAGLLIGIMYAGAAEYLIRRIRRRAAPDRMALAEVVELLRETESVIAQAENWSALDRAEFRIRLSRFGIGQSKYKPYKSYST